jgi:D-alanine-D-alanine ligase
MTHKKLRIGLVFGGRSGEHEVSLASAKAVMENINPDKYEIVPICITRNGTWLLMAPRSHRTGASGQGQAAVPTSPYGLDGFTDATVVTLVSDPSVGGLIPLTGERPLQGNGKLDVIFPVLHGTYGEDGTLQGLLELANVPYVGCNVLGSALGMDKEKMKMVFSSVGLPVGKYLVYRRNQWERAPETILSSIERQLGYPNFVKPVNLGSSVGISKAHNRNELEQAMNMAAVYDHKIIIERGIDCRELECGILGNDEPSASVVGEIIPSNEFYDYNAKYIDNKSELVIPANLPQAIAEEVRRQAIQAFLALDLSGLARVDFFLEKGTSKVYINEVNTLPGFTQISMYPRLWSASGLAYPGLLDRLIELAIERFADRQRNRTSH